MNTLHKHITHLFVAFCLATVAMSVKAEDSQKSMPVVNINEASDVELAYLPGIGPATAAHIIQYRTKQPFQKIQHLMRVKGIGRKTFAKIQTMIIVKGPTTATKKIKPNRENAAETPSTKTTSENKGKKK